MKTEVQELLARVRTGELTREQARAHFASLSRADDTISSSRRTGSALAVVLDRPVGIDEMRTSQTSAVPPGDDEVLVSVRAFSLNFGDLLCVRGLYPNMPPYPFTPGFEAAGVIEATGPSVRRFRPGDEVIVLAGASLGAHASYMTVPEAQVVRKPHTLSMQEACALPAVGITAVAAFQRAQLRRGETILIQTATGGTGLMAVQLARHAGATVIGTASMEHKLEYLQALGVEHAVNYVEQDFEKEVMRLTAGRGVDAVLNTLSGGNIQKGINCLAPKGRYIEIAMTALKSATAVDLSRLSDNQSLHALDLGRLVRDDPKHAAALWQECMALLERGVIAPTIGQTFDFHDVQSAYRCLENRANIGKVVVNVEKPVPAERLEFNVATRQTQQPPRTPQSEEAIAVIGMSGRFGRADSVGEYWEHLRDGKSLIEEVPSARWDISRYFTRKPNGAESTYCKWGSFLRDIDCFDPMFFNISGLEAQHMDPQQRIFLEECWRALEDAGLPGDALDASRTGVMVGVAAGDYSTYLKGNAIAQTFWGNACSVVASRISYFLNLKGPAFAVDTACSSSLVAMHLACDSLRNGTADIVLAGGVFAQTTPEFYLMSSRARMLSPDGQCYAFDQRANGFVPGEAAGVVVLKRLKDAVRDRDNIYGVIRGSLINQDGTTNGITAPSVISQEELEVEVYRKFGIDPAEIQLIEAHGTGTKLGDPIEMQALTKAFRQFTENRGYCAVGSVKTNLGHAATAAGIAGAIKILLSLKHQQIPPSLNFESANELIAFEDSPFYVNSALRPWQPQAGEQRRAAISSFGFGGTNVHMVFEEYVPEQAADTTPADVRTDRPALVPLSARSEDRLTARAVQLLSFLQPDTAGDSINGSAPPTDLSAIAYTLQTGREAMEYRVVFVVESLSELTEVLRQFVAGSTELEHCHRGRVLSEKESVRLQTPDLGSREVIDLWIQNGQLDRLADLWVQGLDFDWNLLYGARRPRRISLPAYPFAKERYWAPTPHARPAEPPPSIPSVLHPWIHRNCSTFREHRFETDLSPDHPVLRDHMQMLPGVVYMEAARAAAGLVCERGVVELQDLVWQRPLMVDDGPKTMHTVLRPADASSDVQCTILTKDAGAEHVHFTCTLVARDTNADDAPSLGRLDIERLQSDASRQISKDSWYTEFHPHRPPGDSLNSIAAAWRSEDGALLELKIPPDPCWQENGYVLHPALMVGACEGEICIRTEGNEQAAVRFSPPFALQSLKIAGPLPERCFAHVRPAGAANARRNRVAKFHIQIAEASGKILVEMDHYAVRPSSGMSSANGTSLRKPAHPFLAESEFGSPNGQVPLRFSPKAFYLADHRMQGRCLLPGVAYLEAARSAGVLAKGRHVQALRNVVWKNPIDEAMLEQQIDVRFTLDPGTQRFSILQKNDSGETQVFCDGELDFSSEPTDIPGAEQLDLDAIRARCPQLVQGASCYNDYASVGQEYGPAFRVLEMISIAKDEALASLSLDPEVEPEYETFALHPALLDGALQALIVLTREKPDAEPAAFMPFSVGAVEILGRLPRRCFAHLTRRRYKPGRIKRFDVVISDAEGTPVVRFSDLVIARKASPEPELMLFRPVWRPDPEFADVNLGRSTAASRSEADSAAAFAVERAYWISPDSKWQVREERKFALDVADSDHWARLENAFREGRSDAPAIVLDLTRVTRQADVAEESADWQQFYATAARIIELLASAEPAAARFAVVYQHGEGAASMLCSALAGFAKSAPQEYPWLDMRVLEIAGTVPSQDDLDALVALEFAATAPSVRVRYRFEDGKWSRETVRMEQADEPAAEPGELPPGLNLNPEGVYLITGGLGGLGRIFASHFAGQQRVHLILTGRSQLSAAGAAFLREIESLDSVAIYRRCDVSQQDQVGALMQEIRREYGRLDGILHAAGLLSDGLLRNKTPETSRAVVAPKIAGTVMLDKESSWAEPDFFVLCSSLAAVVGNAGQADYAFANAFLDAFAESCENRRQRGARTVRTISLNWPVWQTGGMRVSQSAIDTIEARFGLKPLTNAMGVRALDVALRAGFSSVLPAVGDVQKLTVSLNDDGVRIDRRPRERSMEEASAPEQPAFDSTKAGSPAVEAYLIQTLSNELKLPPDKIRAEAPMDAFGIDSLMALNLTAALEQDFGTLPKTLFFEYQTVRELGEYFVEEHQARLVDLVGQREVSVVDAPAHVNSRVPDGSAVVSLQPETMNDDVVAPNQPAEIGDAAFVDALSESEIDSLLGALIEK